MTRNINIKRKRFQWTCPETGGVYLFNHRRGWRQNGYEVKKTSSIYYFNPARPSKSAKAQNKRSAHEVIEMESLAALEQKQREVDAYRGEPTKWAGHRLDSWDREPTLPTLGENVSWDGESEVHDRYKI